MEASIQVNVVRLIQRMELGRQGLKKLRDKRDRMGGPSYNGRYSEEVKGAGENIRVGVAKVLAHV